MKQESNNIMLEPLAIIGVGCRFPGNVQSLNDLWEFIVNKKDAITVYPSSRIKNAEQFVGKNREPDKMITARGGFIENAEYFDADFFNISPLEAEKIDPAQRILLEVAQEAIENSGLTNENLQASNTGVFVANWLSDYEHRLRNSNKDIDVYATTGSGRYALSGRLSYFFNLQGPSLTVDTACSSSLVALNLASQSLQTGECDMAFVGASNTITDFFISFGYSRSGLLSEYGECRFGDERSTGYVRSEGAAVIILKRLSDAIKDGDHIHATILATSCNNDGQSHELLAPSAITQEVMIRKAVKKAGVDPKDIVYVEAHGTGTQAGDPAEINSTWNALSDNRSKNDKLYIGSAKTNFGHTEATAGLAGLLKTVTSIQHKTILPSLHFDHPNTKIKWDEIGITIPTDALPWPVNKPLIAGVSAFGITGTNAHAIISEAPEFGIEKNKSEVRSDVYVLPLSAKNEQALIDLAKKYAEFISSSEHATEDICAMASLHRTHYSLREVFVAESKNELIEKLNDFIENNNYESKKIFDGEDAVKTVFVFPGQGAQWIQMGRALMQNELVYKAALDEINAVYKNYVDWDLIEEINKPAENSRLHEIDVVQPVLVAVEIALASLWMSKGVFPDIVVGHSMGEIAAAYVAGNITLHEAAQIITSRSKLMKQLSGMGEMGATDLTIEEANELLKGYEDKLSVAVMNSKNSTVLSGEPAALNEIFAKLEQQGRFNRKVKVDVASHSPQMDGIKSDLQNDLANLDPKNSSIQFYSTAFNAIKNGEELNANYWMNNLRNPVQFGNAIQKIAQDGNAIFVEMSPHPTLLHAVNENIQDIETKAKVIGSFARDKNEQVEFYKNYTELFCANANFDWKNIYPSRGEFIELPTYAWQKERYWIDAEPGIAHAPQISSSKIENNFYEIEWEEIELNPALATKKILIIKDTYGYFQEIEKQLKEKGCTVQSVELDEIIKDSDADIVLHLRSLYKDHTYSYYYECGVDSLQKLVKQFANKKQVKFCVITNGAQLLEHDKHANLNASLLNGLLRTIQNEYSNISFHQIDISNKIEEAEIEKIVSLIFADAKYKELTVREKNIFTPTIVKSENQQVNKVIELNATYIVTGGNNGLGLETVKWLENKGARNIAIISRSGLNPDAQKAIDELKDINIKSYRADVSDFTQLNKIIEEIRSQQSEIKGVFHAAGILDDATFENLTKEKFENTLTAKANGAWNLHRIFSENTLDLFVVYSSVAGILGSAGQSNYAAANTFLDSLIALRRNNHLAGISINWGTIADIGLAAQQENRGNRLTGSGLQPIPSKELFNYFDQLFLCESAQVMAMEINFEKWAESNPKTSRNYLYAKVLKEAEEAEENKTETFTSVPAAIKHFKQQIKNTISSITKINTHKIREDDTFKSYGIDSLLALQIKNKLQKDLDLPLNVSVIWSHPTVNKLADFLVKELKIAEQISHVETNGETKNIIEEPVKPAKSTIESEVENLSLDELLKQLNEKVN